MSITPNVIDPRRAAPPAATPNEDVDPSEKLRKRVHMGFAACVGVGLVIAVCYIGGRVFAGNGAHAATTATAKVAPPLKPATAPMRIETVTKALLPPPPVVVPASEPVKVQPLSRPAPPAPPAPATEKPIGTLVQGQTWSAVTPQTGETYLQVIALGERFVGTYVEELKGKGLHPLVAPSPMDGVYRILFGPFKNRQSRDDESRELEAAGLQPMVQVY
jgi:hypothetical protein